MNCIERLRYNWFLWFGFKNKRNSTNHPMQHVLVKKPDRIILIDGNKLYYKKSKFEVVDGR